MSKDEAARFAKAVAAISIEVETHFTRRPRLSEPNDERVLEAAVNGRANAIVTFNRKDFSARRAEFGIDVVGPRDALERIL